MFQSQSKKSSNLLMQTFYIWRINSESLLISVIIYEWLIRDFVASVSKLCVINIFSDQLVEILTCNF